MILLGVTASIAAYKAAEVLRGLVKAGHDVQVMMTPSATRFVGALTFQGLSGRPVWTDVLDNPTQSMTHLAFAEEAQAVVIAPASADAMSRWAGGAASDAVSSVLLSVARDAKGKLKLPIWIAPAMHESMWRHPSTQANVERLETYGYRFIGPEKGALGRAGDEGEGRMSAPDLIVRTVLKGL